MPSAAGGAWSSGTTQPLSSSAAGDVVGRVRAVAVGGQCRRRHRGLPLHDLAVRHGALEGQRLRALLLDTQHSACTGHHGSQLFMQDTQHVHGSQWVIAVHARHTEQHVHGLQWVTAVHARHTAQRVHGSQWVTAVHARHTAQRVHGSQWVIAVHARHTPERVHGSQWVIAVHTNSKHWFTTSLFQALVYDIHIPGICVCVCVLLRWWWWWCTCYICWCCLPKD